MPVDREKESFSASPPLCLCHPMSMTARSRSLHSTAAPQSATFAVACLGIAGACYTLDHGVKSFQQWQEQRAASGGDAEAGGEADADGAATANDENPYLTPYLEAGGEGDQEEDLV